MSGVPPRSPPGADCPPGRARKSNAADRRHRRRTALTRARPLCHESFAVTAVLAARALSCRDPRRHSPRAAGGGWRHDRSHRRQTTAEHPGGCVQHWTGRDLLCARTESMEGGPDGQEDAKGTTSAHTRPGGWARNRAGAGAGAGAAAYRRSSAQPRCRGHPPEPRVSTCRVSGVSRRRREAVAICIRVVVVRPCLVNVPRRRSHPA
jgi:hypothetical protein